ncbi:MAG: hypothetical protein CSA68_12615 [Rhodobacterales bacterium]|nr:MAG: hypothetical protein CSA68_12615 [Rhodobacterales bacterium]
MNSFSRRGFLIGAGGVALLGAGCGNGIGSNRGAAIDARVDATLNHLYNRYPGTRDLADKSTGMLVMPLVTEAGLGIGGAYGRGALRAGLSPVLAVVFGQTGLLAGATIEGTKYTRIIP